MEWALCGSSADVCVCVCVLGGGGGAPFNSRITVVPKLPNSSSSRGGEWQELIRTQIKSALRRLSTHRSSPARSCSAYSNTKNTSPRFRLNSDGCDVTTSCRRPNKAINIHEFVENAWR